MASTVIAANRRNSRRRLIYQRARIVLTNGSFLGLCQICDLSASAAGLAFARADAAPGNFILLLRYDGQPHRHCSVVWRSKHSIGVEFIPDLPAIVSAKSQQAAKVS